MTPKVTLRKALEDHDLLGRCTRGSVMGSLAGYALGGDGRTSHQGREDSLVLTNGTTLEVRSASFRRIRGLTCIAVFGDEGRSGIQKKAPTRTPRFWMQHVRRLPRYKDH